MEENAAASGWKSLPFYKRLTITGLLIEALLLLILVALVIAAPGDPEIALIFGFFAVPSVVIAWLLWRSGRWALIVGAVWAVLSLLGAAAAFLPGLLYPNSFFDFGFGLPIIVSLILAVVGSIAVIVQQRRGTARIMSTVGERRVLLATTVVVAVLVVMSGVLHIAGRSTLSAGEKADAIEVRMKNVEFEPTTLRIAAGRRAKIVVRNSDLPVHTFTIKDLDIDETILAGAEKLINLPSLTTGEYQYTCEVPGDDSMKGTLIVTESG